MGGALARPSWLSSPTLGRANRFLSTAAVSLMTPRRPLTQPEKVKVRTLAVEQRTEEDSESLNASLWCCVCFIVLSVQGAAYWFIKFNKVSVNLVLCFTPKSKGATGTTACCWGDRWRSPTSRWQTSRCWRSSTGSWWCTTWASTSSWGRWCVSWCHCDRGLNCVDVVCRQCVCAVYSPHAPSLHPLARPPPLSELCGSTSVRVDRGPNRDPKPPDTF